MLREKIKCMMEKNVQVKKRLREILKGTRAKEKSKKVKRGNKGANSAKGGNKMHFL